MSATTMKTTVFVTRHTEKRAVEIALVRSRTTWLTALFLSGTFGLLSMIFGLGLTLLSADHVFQNEASANTAITILLSASFPLLFLAAHCMDKIREVETRMRIEYCKRLGLEESCKEPSKDK